MAIRIEVEDYCHECPEFEADVDTSTLYACGNTVAVSHVIRCEKRERCASIERYLRIREKLEQYYEKEEQKKNGENT